MKTEFDTIFQNYIPKQVELALAYGCEKNLSHSTLLQYIHQNRHHNGRRIDTIGNYFFILIYVVCISSSLLVGKVIAELEAEMREEVLEKITDQEEKMVETFETHIQALLEEKIVEQEEVKALKENITKQEAKIANLSQGMATNAADVKAFKAKIVEAEEEQEEKINILSQGVAKNAANAKAFEAKIEEDQEEQDKKISSLTQEMATHAADAKTFEAKAVKEDFEAKAAKEKQEQETKVANNLGLIRAVRKEMAAINAGRCQLVLMRFQHILIKFGHRRS